MMYNYNLIGLMGDITNIYTLGSEGCNNVRTDKAHYHFYFSTMRHTAWKDRFLSDLVCIEIIFQKTYTMLMD